MSDSASDDPTALPTAEQIVAALRRALAGLLPPEDLAQVDLDAVGLSTPLLSLPLDSAVLLAVMNRLEDRFSVFIEEEAAFSFGTVGDLADYVRQRLTEKAQRLNPS